MEFALLTLLRLLIPTLMLQWPLFGVLFSTFADAYDWKLFPFSHTSDYFTYQRWDKALDLYYLFFALAITRSWENIPVRRIAAILFLYRLTGALLFFVTGWRAVLLLFPNFFENFVIFYLLYMKLFKQTKLFISPYLTAVLFSALIIPKVIHEYFIHYVLKQPWEIYNVGEYVQLSGWAQEHVNYAVWGGILYLLPLTIVLFLFWNHQPTNEVRD